MRQDSTSSCLLKDVTVSDIAIGAPFEADGTGALYIYNGYSGGVWPEFTQHIRAKDVDTGLRAFGAALTLRPMPQGNGK